MPESFSDLPEPEPSPHRTLLLAAIIFLVVAAVIVGCVTIVPLPVRLFIAVCDLLAAAALWKVLRAKPGGD